MALSPRLLKRARKIPKFSSLGYTRLWGLTNKSGAVSGTAAADTGKFAVKWWDQSVDVFNNGDTFTKSGSGLRAFEVYPVAARSSWILLNFNSNFSDSSGNGLTVTARNGTALSSTQSKFGGYSGFFDGTNDDITCDVSSLPRLGAAAVPFTISVWVWPTTVAGGGSRVILAQSGGINGWGPENGLQFDMYCEQATIIFAWSSAGSLAYLQTSSSLIAGQWNHVVATYDGYTTRMFINGVKQTTTSTAPYTSRSNANTLEIGSQIGQYYWDGYIDDLHIVNGQAIWTDSFTPPTTPASPLAYAVVPSGQFNGFNINDNSLKQVRAESVSLATAAGYYQYGYWISTYPSWNWQPGGYVPGPMEQGDVSDNNLDAAALDQFYTDLLAGTGALYVAGNPGIVADTPTIAANKGYTVYGSVPP